MAQASVFDENREAKKNSAREKDNADFTFHSRVDGYTNGHRLKTTLWGSLLAPLEP
jgi:hypothetical protein